MRLLSLLVAAASLCAAAPKKPEVKPAVEPKFPRPNEAKVYAHDPNVIYDGGYYHLFKGGVHVSWWRAKELDGKWEDMGHLLEGDSIIPNKQNATRPWAPSVIKYGDTYYCYYTLSGRGKRDSAIGVATTDKLEKGKYWKDHGAVVQSGTGAGSGIFPFTEANTIDGSIYIDKDQAYLIFGSFFGGIWQVPLSKDMKSLKDPKKPGAVKLAHTGEKRSDIEGAFMTHNDGYYYLWFSRGECCHFEDDLSPTFGGKDAEPYSIRVARSKKVTGPFEDHDGKKTTEGGGHKVYATNHDNEVFAPGGLGVINGRDGKPDILYYHYFNAKVSLKHAEARLGYSTLRYVKGWPIVNKPEKKKGELLFSALLTQFFIVTRTWIFNMFIFL
ncbi:hypothetical protein AJ79_03963 [Helicocarpus griseus UAMH5409]|uniref:Arabinan endo-1,5-alpha-L-arabinosidase n=1 Tax=Helicocarpus griseus UAMH5409 TaxID=1447875 RepID=A0A2B7XVE8_9EURO|nr:hypothetical protein AJ79_03963 [Helicocarpus griseus UAMH5409]